MKILKYIGQLQTFKINQFYWFSKNKTQDDAWLYTDFHYFYVDEDEDINDIYTQQYKLKDTISSWSGWLEHSDNFDCMSNFNYFVDIKSTAYEIPITWSVSTKELWKDMNANQFKEWFHTN